MEITRWLLSESVYLKDEIEDMVRRIARVIGEEIVICSSGRLLDPETQYLIKGAVWGKYQQEEDRIPIEGTLAGQALEQGEILIEDIRDHPLYPKEHAEKWGFQTLIVIPLIDEQEEKMGVVQVYTTTTPELSSEKKEWIHEIVSSVTRSIRKTIILVWISESIDQILLENPTDLPPLLEWLTKTSAEILRRPQTSIWLRIVDQQFILSAGVPHGVHGIGTRIDSHTLPILERLLDGERYLLIHDVANHPLTQHTAEWARRHGIKDSLFVSIPIQDRCVGTLNIDRRIHERPFTDEDRYLAEMVAKKAGLLILVTRKIAFEGIGKLWAEIDHSLRNPLTTMGGIARQLSQKAEIISEEVQRLERLLGEYELETYQNPPTPTNFPPLPL